jgi:FkbM family methyltransferase
MLNQKLSLIAGKARDNVRLDRALLRNPVLPFRGRLSLAARKYVAIAANRRDIAYLDHTLHYDNRLTPALLPAYLDDLIRLESIVDLASTQTVVDIGANVGQFAATLAWRHPQLRVWSFEPNPVARELLSRNAAQTSGWTVVPYGVGAEDGEIDFFFVPGKSAQGSAVRDNAMNGLLSTGVQQIRAPLRRIDRAFATELGLPEVIDLLKIDVEGAEADALRGVRELRWRHLMLETSPSREGLDLDGALSLLTELHGQRPEVVWAADVAPGAAGRDVVLRMPGN